MFEQFPYTDMHQLNLDWIIKIAKDFLDQYTHIQDVITQGLTDIDDKTAANIEQLDAEYNRLNTLLNEWYNTHSADIAAQLAAALADLNAWYTQHNTFLDTYIQTATANFENAVDIKTAEAIASIPADYSELASVVNAVRKIHSIKTFEGTGMTYFEETYSTIPIAGRTIKFNVYQWNLDGLTQSSEYSSLTIGYLKDDVHNVLLSLKTNDTIEDEYTITFPNTTGDGVLYIGGRVAEDNYGVIGIEDQTPTTEFNYMPVFSNFTTLGDATNIRLSGYRSLHAGYLKQIGIKIRDAGDATIYVLRGNEVLYKFTKTLMAGVNILDNGTDFTILDQLPVNTRIGITLDASNRLYIYNDGMVHNESSDTTASVGSIISIGAGSIYDISVGFIIETPTKQVNETLLNAKYDRAPRTVFLSEGEYYALGNFHLSIIFNSGSGTLRLFTTGRPGDPTGNLVEIGITGEWNIKLAYGVEPSTVSNPTFITDRAITIPWVLGRDYLVELIHDGNETLARITDTVTKESDSISTHILGAGEGPGQIGYYTDRDMGTRNFTAFTEYPFNAKTLIIGDSYSAGATMYSDLDARWCALYNTDIDNKAFIFARGGLATYTAANLLNQLEPIVHPEFVIIALGVNDNSLNNYKGNLQTIVDYVEDTLQATPIIVTIPVTVGANSSLIYDQLNNYIKSTGIKYIDFNKALTVNGDGTTQDLTLFMSDKIHPNEAGHQAIYEQMKIDVPELFSGF